jgi:hypothetical protein
MSDVPVLGPMDEILMGRLALSQSFIWATPLFSLKHANRVIGGGRAEIAELSGVEFWRLVAHDVLENQRRGPPGNTQAVWRGSIIEMVDRDQAARAGHVFDESGRVARQMFGEIARNNPRIQVEGTSRRVADNETNRLALCKNPALRTSMVQPPQR